MTSDQTPKKPVVPAEDLAAEIEELMNVAVEHGRQIRSRRPAHRRAGPVRVMRADKADIRSLLTEELRSALEDEVVPAVVADEQQTIVDSELKRELMKKALVGLRAETLRRIAQGASLDKRGRSEDIAERIARAYRFDESAIAQLVLDNAPEPQPERGHSSRLFALAQGPRADGAMARLDAVLGRYIRVGVARWFVFESCTERSVSRIDVTGRLLAYRAFVDESAEEPTLGSSTVDSPVTIRIAPGSPIVHVIGGDATAARASIRALSDVLEIPISAGLPIGRRYEGRMAVVDPRTVLLLDLLNSRLPQAGIVQRNLTVARFQTSEDDPHALPEDASRPTLKAVRFEGDFLLDSIQACQLIALQDRPLVDASLWGAVDENNEQLWYPIRFSVERDHLMVLTGFGRQSHEVTWMVHGRLVQQAQRAMLDGALDADQLNALLDRMHEFALAGETADKPQMLD
jgi:hypothetical protein